MMKRRTFLAAAVAAAGGLLLAASRALHYWQSRQQAAALSGLPRLPVMPTPIPRHAWDARPVNHEAINEYGFASDTNPFGWYVYPGDLSDHYHTVVVHHSALALHSGETMRSIQDLHMDTRGWADIGYHFGIDAEGAIYAGRDLRARGASVARGNTGVIGVVVMGNFEWEAPTLAQLTALQTLIDWLVQTYALTHLAAHSELNAGTVCPGRYMILYLDLLAQGAGLARV
ncbi:MAG TPA: peptidoglycan recognition family protein [Spirillospora sp.]|nr:peptidoglycan recognition family protein [Spirillospora sp.]